MAAFGGLGRSFAAALLDVGPIPATGRGLVSELGGRDAAVQALTSRDRPPQRSEFADAREYRNAMKDYRSTRQRVLRWSKGTRGAVKGPQLSSDQQRTVQTAMRARKLAEMRARGARGRVKMTVTANDNYDASGRGRSRTRVRVMPARGAAGQYVNADAVQATLTRSQADGMQAGAWEFIEALIEAYQPDLLRRLDIQNVDWIKIWPEGSREPS